MILQAMLCHKMLVAARDGQEDFGEINHDQIKKDANWLGMWPHVATLNIVPDADLTSFDELEYHQDVEF